MTFDDILSQLTNQCTAKFTYFGTIALQEYMLYKADLQVFPWANMLMYNHCKSLTDGVIYLQCLQNAINDLCWDLCHYRDL